MPAQAAAPSGEELYLAIEDTFRRGGNVVIPTFGSETQKVLTHSHIPLLVCR